MAHGFAIGVINTATGAGQSQSFRQLPVRIGRNPLNDLVLPFGFVSQFHAVLETHQGGILLRDLGSTNGTALRSGGMAPPNQLVNLEPSNFEFAIGCLLLRVQPVELPDEQPVDTRGRRPLGVSSYLHAPAAPAGPAMDTRGTYLRQQRQYLQYRTAWTELLTSLREDLARLNPAGQQRLLSQLVRECPALQQEPEFRELITQWGLQPGPSVTVEEVAARGLRELAADFLPQLNAPATPQELVAFLGKVQATLDVFIRSFVPLRDGYQQFRSHIRDTHAQPDPAGLTVGRVRDARELGAILLDWHDQNPQILRDIETTFADLMIHQVAMINGVMSGVQTLLNELAPAAIEAQVPRHSVLGNRHKALWQAYLEKHSDIAEQKQVFALLFGQQFVRAYEEVRAFEGMAGQRGQSMPPERR